MAAIADLLFDNQILISKNSGKQKIFGKLNLRLHKQKVHKQ